MTLLAQHNPLRYAHERFARGGSWTEFLGAMLAIGVILGLLILVQRRQNRRARGHIENDPGKLFRTVLGQLGLGVVSRDILRRMARDLELEHPTTLIMSPDIFRYSLVRWRRELDRDSGRVPQHCDLDQLYRTLFDEPLK